VKIWAKSAFVLQVLLDQKGPKDRRDYKGRQDPQDLRDLKDQKGPKDQRGRRERKDRRDQLGPEACSHMQIFTR